MIHATTHSLSLREARSFWNMFRKLSRLVPAKRTPSCGCPSCAMLKLIYTIYIYDLKYYIVYITTNFDGAIHTE